MRDWRSGIVTVTVRDQRYRQHDPILGVVPLKLSDILTTSSQVTRWYPLDGGIGFGRIRISLLFRSIETRLPPNMLGWDVGTFEFLSDRILAIGKIPDKTKIKLRTGGSIAHVGRTACHKLAEGDGVYWDLAAKNLHDDIRMPVKFRYRAPVVFEFRFPGKRGASAYAQIWLQHLVDNEDTPIDIPIWTTKNGSRLTQNYVTEFNVKAKEVQGLEDLEEIGRLTFRGRFKAGTDESHAKFVADNDSRETYETWEACLDEGVRQQHVTPEIPDRLQELHEQSLTEGRDVLKQAPEEERKKWITKDGQDWSGAFGEDPAAYTDGKGKKIAEPGVDRPPHNPIDPSDDEDNEPDDDDDDDDDSDIGITDATSSTKPSMDTTRTNGTTDTMDSGRSSKDIGNANKRTEKRKHRGLLQWKPARNVQFAADETKFAARRFKNKFTGGLGGREPKVESETGR